MWTDLKDVAYLSLSRRSTSDINYGFPAKINTALSFTVQTKRRKFLLPTTPDWLASPATFLLLVFASCNGSSRFPNSCKTENITKWRIALWWLVGCVRSPDEIEPNISKLWCKYKLGKLDLHLNLEKLDLHLNSEATLFDFELWAAHTI